MSFTLVSLDGVFAVAAMIHVGFDPTRVLCSYTLGLGFYVGREDLFDILAVIGKDDVTGLVIVYVDPHGGLRLVLSVSFHLRFVGVGLDHPTKLTTNRISKLESFGGELRWVIIWCQVRSVGK